MNIEKLVASYFDKKRSQSVKQSRRETQASANKKCYEPENLSFQPRVNEIPKSLYKATMKTECSREDIVQRLYTDRRALQGKRTAQKLSEQQMQFKENCTFHPQTNPNSKKILKTEGEEVNPFQRLYSQGINKKMLSQSLNYIQQNKQNYSFQPQTNYRAILNTETCNLRPIHERIDEIVKQKRQKMKDLQQSATQRQMQDKPKISQISQKIINNKDEFKKNILERVSSYIQEKRKKVENDLVEHEKNVMKQCTFKPQINSTIQVSTSFISRQDEYLRKIEQKLNSRIVRNNFQPQINKISEILVRQEREAQTFEDKINRLTNDCAKRDRIQELERQLYEQCTFVPQINVISKCLAAEHVSHKCDHTPKEEAYEFRPKINRISEQLAKQVKMRKSESADFKQSRKQHLKHLKMQMEYEQLKQCTFKPKLNMSKPKRNTNLSEVKGYQTFTKKMQKINQLKQEQKELRQKLFNRQKNYKSRKSTTPIEFKLSQGYNTKEAIKQEAREKFQKQCTFKPQLIALR